MKRVWFVCALAVVGLLSACAGKENGETVKTSLVAPSEVTVSQVDDTTLDVKWKDNSTGEAGFNIYLILPNDIDNARLVGNAEADATSYILKDESFEAGKSYYVGVRAFASESKYDSRMTKVLFTMAAPPDPNAPSISISEITSHDVCVAVTMKMANLDKNAVCGVCWSEEGEPTVASTHQDAAPMSVGELDKRKLVISNALLDYGKEYNFRAYVKVGKEVYYSEVAKCSLGKELAPIELEWKKEEFAGLPSSVEVYKYSGLMNGRKCNAWYAVADLSKGDVEFRTTVPSSAITIDDQFKSSGKCLVMVNGGYFYNGKNTGLGCVDGVISGGVTAVRGSLKSGDSEYNEMYNVTRGVFGVDKNQKPAVYWTGADGSGKSHFFRRPLPTVKGEDKFAAVSASNPDVAVAWSPYYAQSAGPLLLMDGKCPFDFETTEKGDDFYLSNYEVMPYDIYGTTVKPDRTAAGYTADGKVILFIVDGRIAESDGATLVELAQIMKGLGCVAAVNFDGGGSTGIVVGGRHLNDLTGGNRPVVSTLGFYKK